MRDNYIPSNDSITLLRYLAKMAGIEDGLHRRMVLVVEIDEAPKLYVESFLRADSIEAPPDVCVSVEERSVKVSLQGGIEER